MRSFLTTLVCFSLLLVPFCTASRADLLDPSDFGSLGTLTLSSGSVTIDTDALTISGAANFNGVADNQGGKADSVGGVAGPLGIPEVAIFTFDDISLTGTTNITITGTRALALLSHGDVTIDVTLAVNGEGDGALVPNGSLQPGGPGGFAGGLGLNNGVGPGGGGFTEDLVNLEARGASGGFGGVGLIGFGFGGSVIGAAGAAYGDLSSVLQGGSGGGGVARQGADVSGGGGGGGALEVGALGTITIGPSGILDASGGIGEELSFPILIGGSGSGGGIRIHAAQLSSQGVIRAKGGNTIFDQRPGGGGRVLVSSPLTHVQVIGEPVSFDPALLGIDVSGGDAISVPSNYGVATMTPELTIVPSGQIFELGSITVLQNSSATQPEVSIIARSVQATGNGELTVASGGYTNENPIEMLNPFASITGTGTFTNAAELRGTGSVEVAVVNSTGGEINTINDTLVFTQAVINNAGGQINAINSTLQFDSGLTNNGEMNLINSSIVGSVASTVTSATRLVGSNSVSADYTMADADTLFIGLGGTLPGEFDTLDIGGNATLAGALNVSLDPGFSLTVGDQFEILDIGGAQSGVFAGAPDGSVLGNFGGVDLRIDYDGGDGNDVTLLAALPGDFNFDTKVDGFDFLLWQRNPDVGSLSDWENNFGTTAPLAAVTTQVPEPSGVFLFLLAVGLLGSKRRQV